MGWLERRFFKKRLNTGNLKVVRYGPGYERVGIFVGTVSQRLEEEHILATVFEKALL